MSAGLHDHKLKPSIVTHKFFGGDKSLTFSKKIFQWIKRRSYLASLISERVFLLKQEYEESQFRAGLADSIPEDGKNRLDEFSDFNIYLHNPTPHWQEAFDITMGLLVKFRDLVEARGAKFLLVTLSNPEQVHPFVQDGVKEACPLSFDFERPDRTLEEFAKHKQIVILKLLPAFQEYYRLTGKYLHGFNSRGMGHWNEAGHQLAAEKIFEFLTDKRLVPNVSRTVNNERPMQHVGSWNDYGPF